MGNSHDWVTTLTPPVVTVAPSLQCTIEQKHASIPSEEKALILHFQQLGCGSESLALAKVAVNVVEKQTHLVRIQVSLQNVAVLAVDVYILRTGPAALSVVSRRITANMPVTKLRHKRTTRDGALRENVPIPVGLTAQEILQITRFVRQQLDTHFAVARWAPSSIALGVATTGSSTIAVVPPAIGPPRLKTLFH